MNFSSFVTYMMTLLFALSLSKATLANDHKGLAVVLIDMQDGFYERGGTTNTVGLSNLVKHQSRLLRWAVQNKIPVLVFEYEGYGKTDPRLMNILKDHEHAVVQKYLDGGFYSRSKPVAMKVLSKWKVDTLIVAGVNGPWCVKATIEGALESGFDVITTNQVIGDINFNPPIYPSGKWTFKHNNYVIFPTLDSLIK